jgi:hypothetical protein
LAGQHGYEARGRWRRRLGSEDLDARVRSSCASSRGGRGRTSDGGIRGKGGEREGRTGRRRPAASHGGGGGRRGTKIPKLIPC